MKKLSFFCVELGYVEDEIFKKRQENDVRILLTLDGLALNTLIVWIASWLIPPFITTLLLILVIVKSVSPVCYLILDSSCTYLSVRQRWILVHNGCEWYIKLTVVLSLIGRFFTLCCPRGLPLTSKIVWH